MWHGASPCARIKPHMASASPCMAQIGPSVCPLCWDLALCYSHSSSCTRIGAHTTPAWPFTLGSGPTPPPPGPIHRNQAPHIRIGIHTSFAMPHMLGLGPTPLCVPSSMQSHSVQPVGGSPWVQKLSSRRMANVCLLPNFWTCVEPHGLDDMVLGAESTCPRE